MRVEQHAAEGSLVLLAAENDRAALVGLPCPGGAIGGPDLGSIQIERGSAGTPGRKYPRCVKRASES
jgi:hypothetical protein